MCACSVLIQPATFSLTLVANGLDEENHICPSFHVGTSILARVQTQ